MTYEDMTPKAYIIRRSCSLWDGMKLHLNQRPHHFFPIIFLRRFAIYLVLLAEFGGKGEC